METRLSKFLRSGGNGDYQIRHYCETLVATGSFFSIKSQFPNYLALRESFAKRLDEIIKSNTEMLLQSVGERYDPPLTEKDLPDISAVRSNTLALWEERIEVIWTEWHSHLQRLRPIRESMEQHLLRGFAGLINELRQRGLGIRQYVWRSRDDEKVRSAHAEHDDKVFSWENPPEDGHPGQAFNCRCFAEPLPPGPSSIVVLAELTVPADGFGNPGAGLGRRLARGLIARTPAGLALYAALEANGRLTEFTESASEQQVVDAAATLGVDLGTVEGLWASITYARAKGAASTGVLTGVPKDGAGAEIFAQAMALYAMADPEALSTFEEFQEVLTRVQGIVLPAWLEGRLRDRDGTLASGWAEVFPELTESERRLGQLPGFTLERIEEFREEYPAEVLGLPDNTGSAPDDAPVGSVISTPIPEEAGPNIVNIERTQDELDALASDPAHGGRVNDKSVREREVGLGAEDGGLIRGPIVRDPTGAAEFIDSTGQAWDVKGFRSDFGPQQGGFELSRDMGKVERELTSGHNVIIDTQNMSESDIEAMKLEIESRGLGDRVVFWP
jgi:SPP1 gp7 family putative phage head morphogenesis protein